MLWMTKIFSSEMFVENLSLKLVEFYLKGFKIMMSILLIEINSLLNYSWINYILLKQIIYDSSQYLDHASNICVIYINIFFEICSV